MAPDNPDSWPSNSRRNWLVFYRTDGIALQGGGLIDGRGEKWWNLPCKPHKVSIFKPKSKFLKKKKENHMNLNGSLTACLFNVTGDKWDNFAWAL